MIKCVRAPLVANRFQPTEAAERSPECRDVCHAFAPTQRQPAPPRDHLNPTRVKSCVHAHTASQMCLDLGVLTRLQGPERDRNARDVDRILGR